MGIIYEIDYLNTPVYIGQTIRPLEERWKEHLNLASKDKGFYLHRSMKKYGINNFKIHALETVDNIYLNDREKYWIKTKHTHWSENGYNLTWGGEEAVDSLKSECHQYDLQGNFIQSFESIRAAARAVTGTSNSEGNINKVLQGTLNTAYGYRWSCKKEQTLAPLATNYTGASKVVYQYDLQGNFIQSFRSTKEAARVLNKSQGNISSAARGKRKTAYGFIWSYTDYRQTDRR